MSGWSEEELARIGRTDEIRVASRRPDGTLRGFVTIWSVRVGDGLYVRSAHGPDNPWFQRALKSGRGRVRGSGAERDVVFEAPGPEAARAVTLASRKENVCIGSGVLPYDANPDIVLGIQSFIEEQQR